MKNRFFFSNQNLNNSIENSIFCSQSPDFQTSEDGRVCENLIGFYEAGDDESFQNVLKCGALRSMDNEVWLILSNYHPKNRSIFQYLRVMKILKAPSGNAGLGDGQEDDDDEGLC